MKPNAPDSLFASHPRPSLEKVLELYLAACQSGSGDPPSIEDYLSPFVEPERSSVRGRLEELQKQYFRPSSEAALSSSPPGTGTEPDQTADTKIKPSPNSSDLNLDTKSFVVSPDGTAEQSPAPDDTKNRASSPSVAGEHAGNGDLHKATREFVASTDGSVDQIEKPDGTGEHVASRGDTGNFGVDVKPSTTRKIPETVAGYEIIKVLGRGAMGVVYMARQRGLNRIVALKMILSGEHASEQDLSRFQAEANAVAQLLHPGIVQIYEIGEDKGRPFFSLEFVDGSSLQKVLQKELMSPRKAAALLQSMAEAMHYAHQCGVIHRDLKPANVLMTSNGIPKIGDFGLAKSQKDNESGLTQSGTVLGTPSYMSPEQASGVVEDVGPLTDVYSLGAMLYDMLTGRPPFRGTTVQDTLTQLRTLEPAPPMQLQPGVPRDLETICLKCLQKDRYRRYSSAGELAADIQRFLNGEPILARPISSVEWAWKWSKRNKFKAGTMVGAICAVLAIIAVILVYNRQLSREKAMAQEAEIKAKYQEGIAIAEKENAVNAQKRAEAGEAAAKKQTDVQRDTAQKAVDNWFYFLSILYNAMQSKRLAIAGTPELKKMRADMLNEIERNLDTVRRVMAAAATDSFTEQYVAERLARTYMKFGKSEEPRQILGIALNSIEQRVKANPKDDRARANMGIIEMDLGDIALNLEGDASRALKNYLHCRDLHEEIRTHPRSGDYKEFEIKRILAHDDVHVGRAYLTLGQAEKTTFFLEEALIYYNYWREAEQKKEVQTSASGYIMETEMLLGIAASNLGDSAGLTKHFELSLKIGQDLLKEFPQFLDFKIDNAETTGAYGDALLRQGKLDGAQKQYQGSMRLLQEFYKGRPDDIERQPLLALANERLGILSGLLGQKDEAKKYHDTAMQLRKELWEIEPKNTWRQIGFVVAMARAGDITNAMRLATTIRTRMEKSPELMFQVARCFAICARTDGPDKKKNIEQAISALEIATRADYKDAAMLLTDPDLSALRSEPAFKDLVAKIKAR